MNGMHWAVGPVIAVAVCAAPVAHADGLWVAVANSPSREQQDWAYGPDQVTAELRALRQCAELEHATDCRVLASSPDCIGTAWDVGEPFNQIYAVTASSPESARRGAMVAAGPYANDVSVRCTWWENAVVT